MSGDAAFRITRGGVELIAALEPLYASLHERHATVAPTLAGMAARTTAESWARQRERYAAWLATADAFVLVAARDGEPVGYALVSLEAGFQGWASGERVGVVHDLAVLPAARGAGVGSALLDEVERELAALGTHECRIAVIAANADAIRFYERRGMTLVSHTLLRRIRR